MKCSKCGKEGPPKGVPLYRDNPVGEVPAVWHCRDCVIVPIDCVVEDITETIHQDNKRFTNEMV